MVEASLKNYRQSPRKVRLAADLIRGKGVVQALDLLEFLPKRVAPILKKLLESAIANAKQANLSEDQLVVKEIRVDQGVVLKRQMPRARGSASRINKRTSHVRMVLAPKISEKKK